MQQSHYFLSSVLVYDGPDLKVAMTRALVSPSGIYRVFEESEEARRAFLSAREYLVRFEGQELKARLVRESGPGGSHYNLRLSASDHLKDMLGRFGFASPWRREYARIPVQFANAQVEAPVAAVLARFSGDATAEVKNFSYHGLFLQLDCANPSLGESVGQKVQFRILTSHGRRLEPATARIARIYDEMGSPGSLQRGLGLRILDMSEKARVAYHGMILESCREMRAGAVEE